MKMIGIQKIAAYICDRYEKEYGVSIDEMKLHKLLYFTQRECIIQTGIPITSASFQAWRYGPVSPYIHRLFGKKLLGEPMSREIADYYKHVFDSVFDQYASKKSWSLSTLSHGEISWQNARKGVPSDKNSTCKLTLEDIKTDASRVRLRRFLLS